MAWTCEDMMGHDTTQTLAHAHDTRSRKHYTHSTKYPTAYRRGALSKQATHGVTTVALALIRWWQVAATSRWVASWAAAG